LMDRRISELVLFVKVSFFRLMWLSTGFDLMPEQRFSEIFFWSSILKPYQSPFAASGHQRALFHSLSWPSGRLCAILNDGTRVHSAPLGFQEKSPSFW